MFGKRTSTSAYYTKSKSNTSYSQSGNAGPSTSSIGKSNSSDPSSGKILLPKYSAALGRSRDEYFPAEDLDTVQLELETLLSNIALHYRVLKLEYESLDKDDKKDRRSNKFVDKQPTSPGKRKRALDDKKVKDRITPQFKVAKQKPVAHSPAQSQHTDDSMDSATHYSQHHHNQKDHPKLSIPKNDTPNKFWLSVEPYCMPLTNEDLKLLDDLLEQYNGPLVPPIPELGPHYSTIWASEDLKEEQDNSNVNLNLKSKIKHQKNNEVTNMLKKTEKLMGEGVTGPLTQRLVSALIEENLITSTNDGGLMNADSNSSSENTTITSNSTTNTLRSLSMMKNGISVEKRVKKELIEQGVLDPEEYEKEQEDEILAEIKRVISELSAIAEYNSTELKRLQKAAKAELQRLEIKRKLDAIDQEIIEMYKKVVVAKQKRRPLTNEEQEEIYRLTTEQKQLSDQLESMRIPGPQ